MRVHWSEHAIADLGAIRDHIARDSDEYAARYIERILLAVDRLESFPELGRTVPEEPNDPSLRELVQQSYRIIYRVEEQRVYVVTVVHARRDLAGMETKPWEIE